jgi:hypothetical protein
MERGTEFEARRAEAAARRTAQLLTAHVLMLALDAHESIEDCAVEVARVSRGELSVLYDVHARVRRLSDDHPGDQADRALAIVEGASDRVDSLSRHPSAVRAIDLRASR